jgi:protoheme IX farnesyltransferase
VGYCGVTNQFDVPALILFLIVVFWQMPHFYAIAIYRLSDYKAASIPVLPVKKGVFVTKVHMLLYALAFIFATVALFPYKGEPYLVVSLALGLTWAALCYTGFQAKNDKTWARDVFHFSLVVITLLCVMIAL